MLEALVVGRAEEDRGLEAPASHAVVEDLVAVALVAELVELVGEVLDGGVRERSGVALTSCHCGDFAEEALDELGDGHARRDGVRVHDDVGDDAFAGEGQVFLAVRDAAGALLPVARRELVADVRDAYRARADLADDKALAVGGEHDAVDARDLAVRVAL
eukprot:Amastigsp_a5308_12.p3 type:complete len:160 gc:universal Amastigsp_a5308_12:1865-1386(-)